MRQIDDERAAVIIKDYRNPALTVRDVIARNSIGKEMLMAVVRKYNVEPRGRKNHSWRRPPRGATKPGNGVLPGDTVVEKAKLVLRKRGSVVYGAEVTNGPKARGLFKCDGRLISRDQLLAAAGVA